MKGARLFLGTVHLQNHKIVSDSVRKLAYDIPERNLIMPKVTIISRSYNKHKCKKLNSLKHPVRTTVAGSHN